MAKAKKSILRPVVVFLIGIILIALSFTFWYFIVSPVVSIDSYNVTPGGTASQSPTIPKVSHTVSVNVTDKTLNATALNASARARARASSNIAQVTLKSTFAVSISPSSVFMTVGQSQTFTATVTNGVGDYSYQWYQDGRPILGASLSTYTFNATFALSHTIYVSVIDSANNAASSNVARIVMNATLWLYISPSSIFMSVGESQTFNATVTGGTGNYSYQWYLDNSPVTGATGATWTYVATFAQPSLLFYFGSIEFMQQPRYNTSRAIDHSFSLGLKVQAKAGPIDLTVYVRDTPIFNQQTNQTVRTIICNNTEYRKYNSTFHPPAGTIVFGNINGTIPVSLLDAFSGGTTPYMIVKNLNVTSSTSLVFGYSFNASYRNSNGIPLILFIVGVVLAVVEGVVLLRYGIKRIRQR